MLGGGDKARGGFARRRQTASLGGGLKAKGGVALRRCESGAESDARKTRIKEKNLDSAAALD